MKKIVASVGLLAVGATGVHTASAATLSAEASKPWSVGLTLRGFYDDNVGTAPSQAPKVRSWGYELSPSFALNWTEGQNVLSLGYIYSFKYYEKRPPGNSEKYDMTHTFNALWDHAFTERYLLHVLDSFVIGQEPDVLRAGPTFNTFQRIPGDNIRNYGQIRFNAQFTPVFGMEIGYDNGWFRYDDKDGFTDTKPFASTAGLLDRIEHNVHLDGRWTILPTTTAVVGYRFSETDYTADEIIVIDDVTGQEYKSDSRNLRSHTGYIGLDHHFRPDFSISLRVGARYTEFYNDPSGKDDTSPYGTASLRYTYAPDSTLEFGLSHDLNATDAISASNERITSSAESTTVWAAIHHRITPRLSAGLMGQFQDSILNGGPYNDNEELYYLVGVNLEYRFNPHVSAHAGYNYDKLDSDLSGRSFDRNRFYVGLTATY